MKRSFIPYISPGIVNDLVTKEAPEVLLMLSVPVGKGGEHVHQGHPEGEGTPDTMSSDEDSLYVRAKEKGYISLTVNLLEDGVAGTESNLMNNMKSTLQLKSK